MRFDILTLFPALVDTVLSESVIGRARKGGKIEVNTYNIRDYTKDKHRRVDDTPCGGGMGMLMMAPPIYDCYCDCISDLSDEERVKCVYMSPRGRVLDQNMAKELCYYDRIVILCGHYEGVDQRVIDEIVDEEISIGDYVLTGGEIPACILCDCVSRLLPGVLSDSECHEVESFENDLLEFPQYTRPIEFRGKKVPDVLLSGNHKKIDEWRRERAEEITERNRPDIYARYAERKAALDAEKEAKKARRRMYAERARAKKAGDHEKE